MNAILCMRKVGFTMRTDISGFPEFLPQEQLLFNDMVRTIMASYERFGFVPMDTPAIERLTALLSKGDDNEIYGIYRLSDPDGKKEFGLRFDLTVPLVRYVTKYRGELLFPFKRYQISPVWRGERPQYGRYRQFYQCDIDVIGDEELSINYDAEVVGVIVRTLVALNIPHFHVHLNNRKVLTGFLKTGVPEANISKVIHLIDKMDKISMQDFADQIAALGIDDEFLAKMRNFLEIEKRGDNLEIIRILKGFNFNEEFNQGTAELEMVLDQLRQIDIEDNFIHVSTKLVRGLSYYTGTVFEATLDNMPDFGSIAGGGRYENLVIDGSSKKLPGVGASIGITRLIAKLIEKGLFVAKKASTAHIMVTSQSKDSIGAYMRIAEKLRRLGLNVETYLHEKSLGAQLSYASRKGIKYVLIANEMELLEGTAIIRNLETKEQKTVRVEYLGNDVTKFMSS